MFDHTAVVQSIRSLNIRPTVRPRLLFGVTDVGALRARAAARTGFLARVHAQAHALTATPGGQADVLQPYISGSEGVRVAQACVLTGDPALVPWVKARINALLAMESWFSPVHVGGCRVCDHVMANVAAEVAQMHDLLGAAYTAEETLAVAAGMRRLHFDPYLDGTGDKPEWWFRPESMSNWTIMTCGETGLAACGFAEHLPQANELLARSADGVLRLLNTLPPEGDFTEGVGYWFATLRFGLQYARALRRLSGGAINLFEHPVLRVTGDFLTLLTTPGGRVYNFNDCNPEFSAEMSEALAMLAAESGRGDWMALARDHAADTACYLAYDDPAVADAPLPATAVRFPSTGAATMRSGRTGTATFVGLKSGPSTAGHSHLDANGFVIEAGGAPLITDYRYWPQAHFLGYFNLRGPRWNFDGLATIGHSTLLVDGQGQTWGPGLGGRILDARDDGATAVLAAEGGGAYPGLLKQFTRTILMVKPDVIVIRDRVVCEGERHLEWLLHYAGSVRSEGLVSVIENQGVRLTVTPFLPDRAMGWRVSDVQRASTYECSDTRREVLVSIRYRGFSAFRKAAAAEFLFGLRVNGATSGADWHFTGQAGQWSLGLPGLGREVRPEGDGMICRERKENR